MSSVRTRRSRTCGYENDPFSDRSREKAYSYRQGKAALRPTAMLIMLLLSVTLNAQNMKLINTLEDQHFHVIATDSGIFQTELSSILDEASVGQISSILPHSIISTNDTGRRIWSFTIVYTYPDDISASGHVRRFIVSQSAAIRSTPDRMLAPGDKSLITPVRNCTAMSRPNGKVGRKFQWTSGLSQEIEYYKKNDIESDKRVEVSVDSVIFEDGEIVGPDSVGRLVSINARLDADKSLFNSVSSLQGEQLHDYLKQTSSHGVVNGEYDIYITSLAAHFLAVLDAQGESALRRTILPLISAVPFQNNRIARRTQP